MIEDAARGEAKPNRPAWEQLAGSARLQQRDEVATFLAARFATGITALEFLASGDWSAAFAFHAAGRDYVARFGSFYEDFAKDRLAGAFNSAALPIPQVVELGEAFGGYYAISERMSGAFIDDLGGAEMLQVLPSLFAALDAMRLADLSRSTGFGLWQADGNAPATSWRSWLASVADDSPGLRSHGWRKSLATSPAAEAAFAEALRAMTALLPACPEERQLVHCDLLHNNVLVSGGRLSGVFDWGCSLYGDFLYDVAWLSFCRLWFPAWQEIDFAREAQRHYAAIGLTVPNFAERVRCYELHIGLGALAYNAWRERWEEVARIAPRTLELARAPLPA